MPILVPNAENGSSARSHRSGSTSPNIAHNGTYDLNDEPYSTHKNNSSASISLTRSSHRRPTFLNVSALSPIESFFRLGSQSHQNSPLYQNFDTTFEQEDSQEPSDSTHRKAAYDDLTAIDWQYEYEKERLRVDQVDQKPGIYGSILRFLDDSHIWIVLILTGISVAFVSAFTDIVSRWLADVKFGHCVGAFYLPKDFCCSGIDPNDECSAWSTWDQTLNLDSKTTMGYAFSYAVYVFFAIVFGASACILVLFYAPYSRFSGIAELKTILSGFIIRGFLGFKTLTFKAIGLILVVGAGLWIGKEGPLVHVACCCAAISMRLFPQLYKNEAMKREVLAAASSAGISVAFGSPIGGVLFTLEQLSYYFPERTLWTSFVAAMIAAVTLQFINPFRSGNLVLFEVIYDRLWHRFELVPFAVIGLMGGLYGALFNGFNIKIANWRRRNAWLAAHPILEVAVVALVTGILTYPSVYARIPASISLSHLFQECSAKVPGNLCNNDHWLSTYFELTLIGIQGFFLSAYTFGINIPAGLIMPSMLNGALLGRAVGILMNIWQLRHPQFFLFETCPPDKPCVTPGVYALVGAASTLCGVTNMTVSTVVIMFELTGALTYVIPIMTGVMVSKWVSDSYNRKGIYENWIKFMEYPFLDTHDDESIPGVAVSSLMTKVEDLTIIPADSVSVKVLKDLLNKSDDEGFPITMTESNMTLVGYITKAELRTALSELPLQTPGGTLCTFLTPQQYSHLQNMPRTGQNFASFNSNTEIEHSNHPYGMPDESGLDNITLEMPSVNFRNFAELAPITLSWESSLQLVVHMFRKLGLRSIFFTYKGELKGMLARKNVLQMINSIDTDPKDVDLLSSSSQHARNRLMNLISYSLKEDEDETELLMDEEY